MPTAEPWIKQALTDLRKLDRHQQRTYLENMLNGLDEDERRVLRQELEALRGRVQVESRTYQTRGHADAPRKASQKEAMIARYDWLLHIIDHHVGPASNT